MPEETQDQEAQVDAQLEQSEQQEKDQSDESKPKYAFEAEDVGTLKKKVTITVPRQRINEKLDEMFGELGQSAQVPGFRIGHAPRRLVEKRFGKEVSHDVRNALVGESLGEVMDEADFKTLGEPDLDLEAIELPDTGDLSYSFEVEVAPEFNLPELTGIAVEKRTSEITDENIDQYMTELCESRATFVATDEPAAEGDMITADTRVSGEKIDDPLSMYLFDLYTVSTNLAGGAGISIPCGLSAEGLPIGLHLQAPPFEGERLLRGAHMFQRATGWSTKRPPLDNTPSLDGSGSAR